ncbi:MULTISPECIES: alpha-ketoglutarate-dependent dioxygenase AlkB [unclassified Pseudoalteromonas]|uniref:alpha-ketoglutarate-dependent dioxygenase AlkB n=1 Tax=unclassified Pseudoalteromonas TaxID=194690 RepID=UPI0020974AB3|nr:alpha-ketoglutarate-dependent dioxygenase AlkB [Pseudoalteromonas sp. XMcav2-N]MCO7189153.1 alpha-ketoglutarate-dependent dioxygenase AlkB [Pseudoalteromonas sp. XMcav2-N]
MKLPLHCESSYDPDFLSDAQSQALFQLLTEHFDVSQPEIITLPNGTDMPILPWKINLLAPSLAESGKFERHHGRQHPWFPLIEQIHQRIAELTGLEFAVCVCLYYPDGKQSMDFHCDLSAFGPTNVIASLSIGAERTFLIRNETDHQEHYEIELENGSLFLMGPGFQSKYQHAIARGPQGTGPRFNLTFRQFAQN